MPNAEIQKEIDQIIRRAERFCGNDLPKRIGKEAVSLFKANFDKEGFVDNGLNKWKDVKRRDPSSPWYGFDYKGEKRTSYRFSRDKKSSKTYKSKQQKKLNFSKSATVRKILTGKTLELQRSIRYIPALGEVTISSDKPYAYVQNNGGPIKIFGKKTVMLPARKFIGDSQELNETIDQIINKELDKIFNG